MISPLNLYFYLQKSIAIEEGSVKEGGLGREIFACKPLSVTPFRHIFTVSYYII